MDFPRGDQYEERLKRYRDERDRAVAALAERDRMIQDRKFGDNNYNKDKLYELPNINLSSDQSAAFDLKTKIEVQILNKLTDYIIYNHPRGNIKPLAYQIAVVNVLKNIFKDPNSDIIKYIETKLGTNNEEIKKSNSFFGFSFGGTKRKQKKRKSRRIKTYI